MSAGIIYALGACFIWGLIFVVPEFMEGFNAFEVAMGRYFFFGLISFLLFIRARIKGFCLYPRSIWKKSLYFSLISSIGYYTFVVLGLRYSNPAICALVLGISPISIAFYGNWKQRECSFQSLLVPSILIISGLIIINLPQLTASPNRSNYILGLVCCFWALISWTWFAVANAHFLKSNPELKSEDWSTLVGVSTFIWILMIGCILAIFFGQYFDFGKYLSIEPLYIQFLVGAFILGSLCSWVGSFLWNRASIYLPVSFAGQLMVFETIFGLLFFYILKWQLPAFTEFFGILLFLAAIAYGIKMTMGVNILEKVDD